MTATPDPKTVRDMARKFLLDPHVTHSEFKACIRDHIGADADDETFSAWYDAVRADVRQGTVETVASWPDEQPQDDGEDGSALARIHATLERHAARGSSGGEYDHADIRSILKGRMIWKTAAENTTAERDQLRPEYGIRAEWISTLSSEGPVAETLGDALEALAAFDAKHGNRVVSRTLIERPVGSWRALDDDGSPQQPADGADSHADATGTPVRPVGTDGTRETPEDAATATREGNELAKVERLRRGLRLVLDQHYPIPCSNVRHDGGNGQHCAVCEYDDIETGWWPCPTARGAMAALGDAAEQQPEDGDRG